jgi:exodeoxyribonuclease VII large subunit
VKPEPLFYGDRKVYTVSGFNAGVSSWVARLPAVWVEGEITELRRQDGWATVFFTLKDVEDGSSLAATMARSAYDALSLDLADGDRVHVFGRAELWARRASFQLRAQRIEPVGLGALLLRLEQLKRRLAAEGLFAPERKRPLPRIPSLIGLVTGSDAAAKRDVIATVTSRFPPARILVAETLVQGPRAPLAICRSLERLCASGADVIVIARGGGSFDDLLPFSDERLVRAIAACPVPVVSAVGHEQDVPLCDLVADVRASTPTAAARYVVPDRAELLESLERARMRLRRAPSQLVERKRDALLRDRDRLRRAPALLVERRRSQLESLGGKLGALSPVATLGRGYAIVRRGGTIVRDSAALAPGERVSVRLARGSFGGRVEDVEE